VPEELLELSFGFGFGVEDEDEDTTSGFPEWVASKVCSWGSLVSSMVGEDGAAKMVSISTKSREDTGLLS